MLKNKTKYLRLRWYDYYLTDCWLTSSWLLTDYWLLTDLCWLTANWLLTDCWLTDYLLTDDWLTAWRFEPERWRFSAFDKLVPETVCSPLLWTVCFCENTRDKTNFNQWRSAYRLRSARENSIGKYYTIYEGIKCAETSVFICFDDDPKVQA